MKQRVRILAVLLATAIANFAFWAWLASASRL
jgi:hypothetical protein